MDPFITHTGRAVPLRRSSVDTDQIIPAEHLKRIAVARFGGSLFAAWQADPGFVLNQPAYAGATILITGPDFGAGRAWEEAAWALADYGFRVVISSRFSDILYDHMIKAGIVLAQLPDEVTDKLLRAVETDPQIAITVDLDRRELSASGWPCAVFEINEYARRRLMAGRDVLADRLLTAQRRLASGQLAADVRIRLQRRLMAICDAMKAPGADTVRGGRRLEKFLEELGRAGGDGD